MAIQTTTHLNFRGDAREALEFYRSVFDAELTIASYSDFGMPEGAPGADKVVFGRVTSASGLRLMGYDIPGESDGGLAGGGSTRRENGVTLTDQALFVSLAGETLDEVQAYWNELAAGGVILEPLAASAWSAGFGMLTDRYGVTWTVTVDPSDSTR